ncbi:MAG: hypothetical protein JWQ19_335 [Subtercola sp.]|nr:hypothetical protein [Subtercola sp.]
MPSMEGFRRLILGRHSERRSGVSSSLASAGRLQVGGLAAEAGPFDQPPLEEPQIAENDLPWELQPEDDEDAERP